MKLLTHAEQREIRERAAKAPEIIERTLIGAKALVMECLLNHQDSCNCYGCNLQVWLERFESLRLGESVPALCDTLEAAEGLVEELAKQECSGLQLPSVADMIEEELQERNWTLQDLVSRFGNADKKEAQLDLLAMQMMMAVRNRSVLLGELSKKLSRAFGVSEEFFSNMEKGYREQPDCGTCPPCRARAYLEARGR